MTKPISGNALVRARTFLGWTQEVMAARLGLSRSTYQRREALAEEALPLAESTQARMVMERVVLEGVAEVVWRERTWTRTERLDERGENAQVEADG